MTVHTPCWPSTMNASELADEVEAIDKRITSPTENAILGAAAAKLRSLSRELSAAKTSPSDWHAPAGWKLVPLEATPEMLQVSRCKASDGESDCPRPCTAPGCDYHAAALYRSMLLRSPEPPTNCGGWLSLADRRRPAEGERVWIAGYGFKGRFYAEAEYRRGEWLMFDQEVDEHIHPCQYPAYWQPIAPIPETPARGHSDRVTCSDCADLVDGCSTPDDCREEQRRYREKYFKPVTVFPSQPGGNGNG